MRQADFQDAARHWLCAGCNWVKPIDRAIDVKVDPVSLHGTILNAVFGTGLTLAHDKLLELLPAKRISEDFAIGKVYSNNEKLVAEWQTLNSKHRVILRGERNVCHRVCEMCNRNVYFAQGKSYLLSPLPAMGLMLGTDLSGIIVTDQQVSIASLKGAPGVDVVGVSICKMATDGLGELGFYAD